MELAEAIGVEGGVVSVVGAGGKKSTMYRLADELERAIVTATVRIPIFDHHVSRVIVTADPTAPFRGEPPTTWPLGLVPHREDEDRYLGYDLAAVDDLVETVPQVTTLVKADGARMREFKAPDANEPQIPRRSTVVVPVVSTHAVGEPLGPEVVHRPERVAALTALDAGDDLTPSAIATVLAHPDGGAKEVPSDASFIPLINKVDDADRAAAALDIATELLDAPSVNRVVLTQLTAADPVVAILD